MGARGQRRSRDWWFSLLVYDILLVYCCSLPGVVYCHISIIRRCYIGLLRSTDMHGYGINIRALFVYRYVTRTAVVLYHVAGILHTVVQHLGSCTYNSGRYCCVASGASMTSCCVTYVWLCYIWLCARNCSLQMSCYLVARIYSLIPGSSYVQYKVVTKSTRSGSQVRRQQARNGRWPARDRSINTRRTCIVFFKASACKLARNYMQVHETAVKY